MTSANPPTCSATTRSGKRCGMRPLHGESHCYTHSPTTSAARAESTSRGGAARGAELAAGPAPAMELAADDDALVYLDDLETAQRTVTLDLLAGRLSAREAMARTKVIDALARRIHDVDAASPNLIRPTDSRSSD